jgi:tungstate transport system substrate-binding protein
VIVGPKADPAKLSGVKDVTQALRNIATAKAPFASRGDDSGTHRMELRLWKAAGVDPKAAGNAAWYRETGAGMGPTLNTAAGLNAYVLTDRATWANFKNRQDLTITMQGDARLHNPYGSILVNPARGAHIKAADAKIWHEWLTSDAGRAPRSGSAANSCSLRRNPSRAPDRAPSWTRSAAPFLLPSRSSCPAMQNSMRSSSCRCGSA